MHPQCAVSELPEFTFLNLKAWPKGWNDESLDMLWRYNLHYFDGLTARNMENVKKCEELIGKWIAENPRGSVPGWDPYPTSLRIVNWVKWLLDGGSTEQVEHVDGSIRAQVEWLEQHVEWHIMANHLMANLKALIIGNKYLGRDYSKWMRLYREQIAEQVLPDGGHFERSVMYHAIMLEDVLDVMRLCGVGVEWLKPVAEKMLRYLVNMTGPDGKIAMFNDAAEGIAKPTEWLCRYAQELGVKVSAVEPFMDFPDAGYTRMMVGDFVLFADTGPIGPDYQPGHAHADTLTYELYYKNRKFITDAGTSEYRGTRRAYERSTAAHNVVEIGGCNSSEVWSSHRVGARARIVERRVEPTRIYAAHDGYGGIVGREFELTEEGLIVRENVAGRGKCVTRVHCAHEDLNWVGHVDKFEYAVEFGKLEQGICLSMRFDAPGGFGYTIKPCNDTLCVSVC